MDFLKKNSKYIGFAGCALMLIGCFFPFAKVTVGLFGYSQSQSVNFIDGDGVFVLIAAIVTAVLIYLNKYKLSFIPTGIGAIVTIYDMINAESVVGGNTYGLGKVSFGLGAWTILLGVVLAVAYAVVELKKAKETAK